MYLLYRYFSPSDPTSWCGQLANPTIDNVCMYCLPLTIHRLNRSSLVRVPNHLNPRPCFLRHPTRHSIHCCAAVLAPQSASAKLFVDAAREEGRESNGASAEGITNTSIRLESLHDNWTGEESIQDAVLRMLVDKYKPLRSGPTRTADERLKDSSPQVRRAIVAAQSEAVDPTCTRRWQGVADTPLLAGIEGHRLGIRPSKRLRMRPHR